MKQPASSGSQIRRLRNLIAAVLVVGVAAYTTATYVLVQRIFDSFGPAVRQDLEWKASRGAPEVARAGDLGLAVLDGDMVKEAFGAYAKSDDVLAIVALDSDGGEITRHGESPEDTKTLFSGPPQQVRDAGDHLVTWASSAIEGKEVGKIAIVVTTKRLRDAHEMARIMSIATLVAGALGMIFGMLVLAYFAHAVALRDQQLAEHAATLEKRVEDRTRELDERNRGMRLVLDHVAQGLITIDLDGVMAAERSAIVDTWFGAPATGVTFDKLVEPRAARFAESFRMGLESIRDGFLPLDLLLDQMPKRFAAGQLTFDMDCSAIPNAEGKAAKLLLIITDVTAAVARERIEREQRQAFALFQKVAADRSGFESFFDEATHIVAELASPGDPLVEKRLVHTLKGNCGIYGIEALVELCHQVENALAERGGGGLITVERGAIATAWAGIEEKVHALLGLARRDVIEIESGELRRLLERVAANAPGAEVAATLRSWKNEPVVKNLARLGDHAKALSRRLGKDEVEVQIDSAGVRLDAARWTAFWSNLVHAVRNAVDHGVEDAATRAASGKAVRAEIRMSAATVQGQLVITLADDGRGIDWDRVREKARRVGLPHANQRDLVEALFADGLSTNDAATTTSGRGVGLGALRQAVRELGGQVDVLSEAGAGSKFVFRFVATPSIAVPAVAGRN